MTILGIDPGLGRVGYAIITKEGSKLLPVDYGVIETPMIAIPDRLRIIHDKVVEMIELRKPDVLATERQFFTVNKTTAMDVAKALGVILLASNERGLPWAEYSPPEIKQAIVGNGNAEKKQVQFMVTKLLGLAETPKPDDAADALAIAICHAMRGTLRLK